MLQGKICSEGDVKWLPKGQKTSNKSGLVKSCYSAADALLKCKFLNWCYNNDTKMMRFWPNHKRWVSMNDDEFYVFFRFDSRRGGVGGSTILMIFVEKYCQ